MKTNKIAREKLVFLNKIKNIKSLNKKQDLIKNQKDKDKEDKYPQKILFFSILIGSFLTIGILLIKKRLPPELPLFYGLPEGEGQLVKTSFLTLPAVLIIFFSLINFLIQVNTKDKFIKDVLIYSLLFLSFFLLVAIFKVVFLVGNI